MDSYLKNSLELRSSAPEIVKKTELGFPNQEEEGDRRG
jgi:hypothetical protein